jgi:hypothetical protein
MPENRHFRCCFAVDRLSTSRWVFDAYLGVRKPDVLAALKAHVDEVGFVAGDASFF